MHTVAAAVVLTYIALFLQAQGDLLFFCAFASRTPESGFIGDGWCCKKQCIFISTINDIVWHCMDKITQTRRLCTVRRQWRELKVGGMQTERLAWCNALQTMAKDSPQLSFQRARRSCCSGDVITAAVRPACVFAWLMTAWWGGVMWGTAAPPLNHIISSYYGDSKRESARWSGDSASIHLFLTGRVWVNECRNERTPAGVGILLEG